VFVRCGSRRLAPSLAASDSNRRDGLYLRALLEGGGRPARSEELRARLEAGATSTASVSASRLAASGPEAAIRIGSRDRPKMIRAIEVCLLTGRPLTEVHRPGELDWKLRSHQDCLQPPRARCTTHRAACHTMLDRGWIEEVPASPQRIPHNASHSTSSDIASCGLTSKAPSPLPPPRRRFPRRRDATQAPAHWFRKEPSSTAPGFGDDAALSRCRALIAGHLHSNAALGAASV